jgi:hypothetical protein
MPPMGTLLAELWKLNPSFIIVFDRNSRKTCVMEGDSTITEEDHIDGAIYKAWMRYFGGKDKKNE